MATPHRARPLLEPYWSVYALGEHSVELRSLGRAVRLSGIGVVALFSRLMPVLDGQRTVEEICDGLPEGACEDAPAFMTRLLAQGLLSDAPHREAADTGAPGTMDECLRALVGAEALSELRSRLAGALVAVCGADSIARTFVQILCDRDIRTVSLGDPAAALEPSDALRQIAQATLVAGFGSGLRDSALGRMNALSLTTGTPWLAVASDGIEAHLGPLVLPGRSACLACFHERADALGRTPPQLLRPGSRPMLPGTDHLVAGVAAAEAVKFLIGIDRGALVDAIVRIHLRTLEWDRVDVLTVPRCPACSGVSVASA